MCSAQNEKKRTNQRTHDQDGCKHAETPLPRPRPDSGGGCLLSLPGARAVWPIDERCFVSLYALVLVQSTVTVRQQAMAYACQMLCRLRLRAVYTAKIADKTLILLTRLFR